MTAATGGHSRTDLARRPMLSGWEDESEALLRVVEGMAGILNEAGIPRTPARVLAYMLADDADRHTSAALAEGLRVSPAAISGRCAISPRRGWRSRRANQPRGPSSTGSVTATCKGWLAAAWIPVLKHWESALERATVELGAHGGDGGRLAEAPSSRSCAASWRQCWSAGLIPAGSLGE